MIWKEILKGHEDEDNPHIQTFREKGTTHKPKLKVTGEKKRKKGTKNVRDYPIRERSFRREVDPIAASVSYSIFRVIHNIVKQTQEDGSSKLLDDHPDDYEEVWKNNPKLKDMAEGRLKLDQLFQQSRFEYPDHFEYDTSFMEEKEAKKRGEYLEPITIPDDIRAKVSNKANYKITWVFSEDTEGFGFDELISDFLDSNYGMGYFVEKLHDSFTRWPPVKVRYTKPGYLGESKGRHWGIDPNGIVYVARSLEYKKEKGEKIYPTVTRQGKEQILNPDDTRNRHQGDVPENRRMAGAEKLPYWKKVVKADTEPEWSEEKKNQMRQELKEEGVEPEYIEQYIYEGPTKTLEDDFGKKYTGEWWKEYQMYVEVAGEEESRDTFLSILRDVDPEVDARGKSMSTEELGERFEDTDNWQGGTEIPPEAMESPEALEEYLIRESKRLEEFE